VASKGGAPIQPCALKRLLALKKLALGLRAGSATGGSCEFMAASNAAAHAAGTH
jgi:hypothetical protein